MTAVHKLPDFRRSHVRTKQRPIMLAETMAKPYQPVPGCDSLFCCLFRLNRMQIAAQRLDRRLQRCAAPARPMIGQMSTIFSPRAT